MFKTVLAFKIEYVLHFLLQTNIQIFANLLNFVKILTIISIFFN